MRLPFTSAWKIRPGCLLLLLLPLAVARPHLGAKLAFEVADSEHTDRGSLVTLRMANAFDQPIRNIRVWCFAFDAEGRVTGQRSAWIRAHDRKTPDSEIAPLLTSEEESSFRFFVPPASSTLGGETVRTQATVVRIVFEDGSLADPENAMIPFSEWKPSTESISK